MANNKDKEIKDLDENKEIENQEDITEDEDLEGSNEEDLNEEEESDEDKDDKDEEDDLEEGLDNSEEEVVIERIVPPLDEEKTKELVDANVTEIFEGQELSEDLKKKIGVIYEAALKSRLSEEIEKIEEAAQARVAELVEKTREELVDKQDEYLALAVEQWNENNAVGIEKSLKLQILEGFFEGLRGLFQEHNIDIPEETVDALETANAEIEALKAQVNEATEKAIELGKELLANKKAKVFDEISEGLTDVQVEKLAKLVESVEAKDLETYKEKATIIREEFMKAKKEDEPKKVLTEDKDSLVARVKQLNRKD